MDKKKFPREGTSEEDGLPVRDSDTEGHGLKNEDEFNRTGPGTGGDMMPRRPSSGGELIDETDVEGHGLPGDSFDRRGPGTGGDAYPRRPSSGGELIDDKDVEGHRLI
ncbi:MAG TPA: hypothetical protein VK871_15415 [Candidatus Limnocylindrales bacterium]|nr:hypothetical protein [Candidatus Limnocylindrales bacterium]